VGFLPDERSMTGGRAAPEAMDSIDAAAKTVVGQ
jgi:hypothetical protein